MFRPDGFHFPHGGDEGDDGPDQPDDPIEIAADDPPPRNWFWPAFCLGFVLVLLLT